ncbi:MAG: c-type cytochrome, partial [Betaproteobacteria bacterium]
MHEHDQHVSPIKNWKQLVVIVVLAFVVPITLIVLLSQLVTSGKKGTGDDDSAVLNRIKPVGEVKLATASGPRGQLAGEQVYGQVCKTCHEAGLAGAPKIGDKAAWGKVIAQGDKVVVDHALKGIRAMPAKGGNPDLDDVEVQRAVVFMANKAGAGWKEPPSPAGAPAAPAVAERSGEQVVAAACGKCHQTGERGAPKIGDRTGWAKRAKDGYNRVLQSALKGHAGMPARGGLADLSDAEVKHAVEYMMNSGAAETLPAVGTPVATAAATPVAMAAATPAAAAKPDGRKIYDTTCTVCHATGVAGAPKFGDKTAWAPRLKSGIDALYASALKGKAGMPPKGGNTALPDADVKAAVDYMA